MKDKIREIIELNDSLVGFKHGNEHCILPEHYDELAQEIADSINGVQKESVIKKKTKFTSKLFDLDILWSAIFWFICIVIMIGLDNLGVLNKNIAWVIGCVMGFIYMTSTVLGAPKNK